MGEGNGDGCVVEGVVVVTVELMVVFGGNDGVCGG